MRLEYKGEKKLQIGLYIVLKNYKDIELLFLNILRCNHFPIKTKRKINTMLVRIFFFFFGGGGEEVEVRVVLKSLTFNTSKSYFIYFTTLFYNTANVKFSIFLSLHLK